MRFTLLTAVEAAALASFATADVKFTSPKAGASIAGGGNITVEWTDSGVAPAIAHLKSYQLFICAGGNDEDTFLQLSALALGEEFTAGNKVVGTINVQIGPSTIKNAYFLRIISVATAGGQVVNYSSRFSLTGMTGELPALYEAAAKAITGTDGPATLNQVNDTAGSTYVSSTTTSALSTSTPLNSGTVPFATSSASRSAVASPTTEPSSGLSTGAKAAIGVCIPIVVLVIAVVLFIFLRSRKSTLHPDTGKPATPSDLPEVNPNPFGDEQGQILIVADHSTDLAGLPGVPTDAYELPDDSSAAASHTFSPPLTVQEADSHVLHEMPNTGSVPSTQKVISRPLHEISARSTSFNSTASQPNPVPTSAEVFQEPQSPIESNSPSITNRKSLLSPASDASPTPKDVSTSEAPQKSASMTDVLDDDDPELAQIEKAMIKLRERKQRLQQLEDLERQEAEMEARMQARRQELQKEK